MSQLETPWHWQPQDKAVEQAATLASLPIPRKENLASIQSWLERPMMGNWSLLGRDSDIWGSTSNPKSHAPDLFTFMPRHDADPFSEWVAHRFIVWFHNCIGYRFHNICDPDTGIVYYDDENLLQLTSLSQYSWSCSQSAPHVLLLPGELMSSLPQLRMCLQLCCYKVLIISWQNS